MRKFLVGVLKGLLCLKIYSICNYHTFLTSMVLDNPFSKGYIYKGGLRLELWSAFYFPPTPREFYFIAGQVFRLVSPSLIFNKWKGNLIFSSAFPVGQLHTSNTSDRESDSPEHLKLFIISGARLTHGCGARVGFSPTSTNLLLKN